MEIHPDFNATLFFISLTVLEAHYDIKSIKDYSTIHAQRTCIIDTL